jgi:hypothetical protein
MKNSNCFNFITNCIKCLTIILLASCGGGGGGSDTSTDTPSGGPQPGSVKTEGATLCGVTVNGRYQNPPDFSKGETVTSIQVIDSNLLNVTTTNGNTLIKLQGLGDTAGFNNTKAKKELSAFISGRDFKLFKAGCSEETISGKAEIAQLITETGLSFSEKVVTEYMGGVISKNQGCAGNEFAGCLNTLSKQGLAGTPKEDPVHECQTAPLTVQYRPNLKECNNNAAVILSGTYLRAFSIQLRLPDGGDRLDEDCSLASCTPYKVQRYIDGADTKTACFGAPGNANVMNNIHHTSIKMAGDDNTPERFCIPDMSSAIN